VPHSRYGHGGEEKNPFIAPAGNRTPVVQPVAYLLNYIQQLPLCSEVGVFTFFFFLSSTGYKAVPTSNLSFPFIYDLKRRLQSPLEFSLLFLLFLCPPQIRLTPVPLQIFLLNGLLVSLNPFGLQRTASLGSLLLSITLRCINLSSLSIFRLKRTQK